MDFTDWKVGSDGSSATHASGFTVTVEGSPRDPSGVHPGRFPPGLSAIEQVRLLRHGVEAIAQAARRPERAERSRPAPKPERSSDRPVLSIRRASAEQKSTDTKTPA